MTTEACEITANTRTISATFVKYLIQSLAGT